ncbi:hypothetical protein Tco_0673395 [Tanacetum coccineum]
MPRKSSEDYKNTRDYIPIISHQFRTPIREKLRNLEQRCIHEGRVVFDNFTDLNYVRSLFEFIEFECLLEINEQVCPRFILEFYSQYQLSYSDEGEMFVEFVIQNQLFSYSLENFAQILGVPCEGACVFSDRWRVDELIYGIPTDGPYQTNLPPVEDIISSIRVDRDGQVRRIRHEEEIDVLEYQVLTREIEPSLKPLEEIIRENVFCPGSCLLTRLFTFIMNENPELNNESYVLYDHVMTPLAAQLERKPRRDRGMRRGRHSTSSSSAFDQPSSSHLNDDDDYGNDEGTSRASTPSPICYVNSLTDQVPQVLRQGHIRKIDQKDLSAIMPMDDNGIPSKEIHEKTSSYTYLQLESKVHVDAISEKSSVAILAFSIFSLATSNFLLVNLDKFGLQFNRSPTSSQAIGARHFIHTKSSKGAALM